MRNPSDWLATLAQVKARCIFAGGPFFALSKVILWSDVRGYTGFCHPTGGDFPVLSPTAVYLRGESKYNPG